MHLKCCPTKGCSSCYFRNQFVFSNCSVNGVFLFKCNCLVSTKCKKSCEWEDPRLQGVLGEDVQVPGFPRGVWFGVELVSGRLPGVLEHPGPFRICAGA
jgi:hypothetical protein